MRVTLDTNPHYISKLSELDKLANMWLRQWLLNVSPTDKHGRYQCFITEKWYDKSELDVAHLFPRQYTCTRFDEDNVRLTTRQSNNWDDKIYNEKLWGKGVSKHIYEYTYMYILKYGEEKYNELQELADSKCTLDRKTYLDIIQQLKDGEN